jgi:hypothetical protein
MDWGLGSSVIGVIAAGIVVGLLLSFYIISAQKKKLRLSEEPKTVIFDREKAEPFHKVDEPVRSFEADRSPDDTVGIKTWVYLPARDNQEVYHSLQKSAPPVSSGTSPLKGDALIELENNLSIASRPMTNKLVNFHTNVWSTRRSEFNLADATLLGELTEAYVDMLLANNIVWLVMELGRESQDLNASYYKLSGKIAERLLRIMPEVRNSF